MSVRLEARRAEAQRQAVMATAEAYGLTLDQFNAALQCAYVAWSCKRPWRWLPESLCGVAFDFLGRSYAARVLSTWGRDG